MLSYLIEKALGIFRPFDGREFDMFDNVWEAFVILSAGFSDFREGGISRPDEYRREIASLEATSVDNVYTGHRHTEYEIP